MKKFKFKKIDAFAAGLSTGNPAAGIYLDSFLDITEEEMLRIARELKGFVSEVGYIAEIGPGQYKLRYFSSEKEVQFCGHATIAIIYDLLKQKEGKTEGQTVILETNKGRLGVENRIKDMDSVFITAPVPRYSEYCISPQELCEALSMRVDVMDREIPAGIVNAGNETLCVPIRTLDDLVTISPHYETLKSFCSKHQLDVITVFSRDVADKAAAYRTRVFAAPFGYLEDPATGSGNAALGYHLLKNNVWHGENISLEQNNDKINPNIIKLSTKKEPDGSLRVVFGGAAIIRVEGYYQI